MVLVCSLLRTDEGVKIKQLRDQKGEVANSRVDSQQKNGTT